eukprot:1141313-Pelagomonas_calceolata.AAC.5
MSFAHSAHLGVICTLAALLPGTDQNHHSRTSKDVMRGVWHEYGVMGLMGPACTQQGYGTWVDGDVGPSLHATGMSTTSKWNFSGVGYWNMCARPIAAFQMT